MIWGHPHWSLLQSHGQDIFKRELFGLKRITAPSPPAASVSPGREISEVHRMCDAFVGTWKLVSSENFDDYMKEVGEYGGVWGFPE